MIQAIIGFFFGCRNTPLSTQPKTSVCVFLDENNAFRTCPGAAAGEYFFAGGYIETVDGDVAFIVQRVKMLRDGMATGIANALPPLDPNFQLPQLATPRFTKHFKWRFTWDHMDPYIGMLTP